MKAPRGQTNGGPHPAAAAVARASFEHALDPMLLVDDDRRCTGANPAACSLLGVDHEAVLSRRLDDFVPTEAQAALQASWPDFLERGYQSTELELVVADGSRRTMEARTTARVLPGCHLSVLRDITDRAAAETVRRTGAAYEFLARVLEHVDEGLHVIDEQRRICFVNPVGEAMLGYDSSELLTLPVHETIHHTRPDGSHFPADECPHLAVFETGRSIRGEDWFVRKDGSMLAVAYSAAPIPLPGGRGAVVAFRDIGEHARLQLEREHEREFLDAVLESLDTGVVACGPDGALSLLNGATRTMHGLAAGPLSAVDWAGHYDLFLPDGLTPIGAEDVPLARALRGERLRDVELVIAAKHGSPRTVLCNAHPIESKDGRALGAVVAVHDVTQRKRAEQQLVHHAMHDSLTGLPNRGLLLDRLGHALAVARRDGAIVAVLFADLDRFMLVIETLGHQRADEMIVAVAARWDEALRAADTVGRLSADTMACLGGDQFVVLAEGLTCERDAIGIAERMAKVFDEPFVVGDEQVFASASIGIALGVENETADSLLGDAGAAMKRAKERGRGRYELADEAMRTRVGDRLRKENELRRSIEQEELRLHYQPIVSLSGRRVIGAEALVRWEHPERGLLAPGEFIGLAEDCGLIIPLGRWVLHEACRQIARWEQSFGDRLALPVSINVSTRQLATPQIVGDVKQAVAEAGIDPSHLALEITETVLMEDGDTPVARLEALKRIGTPLVLDDFGTGYSSLSYLGRLPLDVLKLDRSFVAPLGPDGQGREIAAAVVELAHALELTIVAEGVETEDQLEALQQLGFDRAQGYLFARPMPATEMTDLISAAVGEPPR